MNLKVSPSKLLIMLLSCVGVLALLHVAGDVWVRTGHGTLRGLVPAFNLDREGNVPTFFSSALVFGNAVMAVLLYTIDGRNRGSWLFLAAIMVFLAFDEIIGFHEQLANIQRSSRPGVAPHLLWVLPYALAAGVVGAIFLPFLRRLDRRAATLMVGAGAVYVLGATGLETVTGLVLTGGVATPTLLLGLIVVEESLEMIGMSLCLFATTDYVGRVFPKFALQLGDADGAPTQASS